MNGDTDTGVKISRTHDNDNTFTPSIYYIQLSSQIVNISIFREMYLNSSINVSEVRLSLYLTAFVLRYLLTY